MEWVNRWAARQGPRVWELEGPMPILKMSNTEMDSCGKWGSFGKGTMFPLTLFKLEMNGHFYDRILGNFMRRVEILFQDLFFRQAGFLHDDSQGCGLGKTVIIFPDISINSTFATRECKGQF